MLTKIIIIINGHLFFGDVEFTECTSADLRELPTLKRFRFIVIVYFR